MFVLSPSSGFAGEQTSRAAMSSEGFDVLRTMSSTIPTTTTTNTDTTPAAPTSKAALLDDEGDLTPKVSPALRLPTYSDTNLTNQPALEPALEPAALHQFECAITQIFARFSTSYNQAHATTRDDDAVRPSTRDVWTESDLDAFSTLTNGGVLSRQEKEEMRQFLDTDEHGNLTLRGLMELYHLQSDNDARETWSDLERLGYDEQLMLESHARIE